MAQVETGATAADPDQRTEGHRRQERRRRRGAGVQARGWRGVDGASRRLGRVSETIR
jgi:hypothetical protein